MMPESKSKHKVFQLLTYEVQEKLDYYNSFYEHSIALLFEYLTKIKDRNFISFYKSKIVI